MRGLTKEERIELITRIDEAKTKIRSLATRTGSIYAESENEFIYDLWVILDSASSQIFTAGRLLEKEQEWEETI